MIKILIVEDERLARVELKRLLAPYENIQIAAEAADFDDALEKIKLHKPDLLFLDIQLPGKTGFELLEQLDSVPDVIFTTAFDEYALKAFEFNALDYLLKPIEPRRLDSALKKAFSRALDSTAAEKSSSEKPSADERNFNSDILSENDQIFVKDGDKCWFVRLSDIRYFESEGNYVRIYFGDFKPLILKSLNSIDERLDTKTFFRANRSHIVNLKWIEGIEPSISGGLIAILKGGDRVEISRRQSLKFRDMLSL